MATPPALFAGRTLVVATKHEKETVMAPMLEAALGVRCVTCPDLDTDTLGTFSGEVERPADPIGTARLKCHIAMERSGHDLVIASEGSFGPHPSLYFVPADDELLLLIDRRNGLEIAIREVSTETNFQGRQLRSEAELAQFAEGALFPTHGLILRPARNDHSVLHKGITDWDELRRAFQHLTAKHGGAYAETDMRAHMNPTRMRVIAAATERMVQRLLCLCPECATPGFGVTGARVGLPCACCGYPTNSVAAHIRTCQSCRYQDEVNSPHGKEFEDPKYCDICNP